MTEQVLCVLHNVKKSKMLGRWDTYNVAVTSQRCIFAKLTAEMLKQAAADANKAGKEEGKGFFARWGDQLAASLTFGSRYLNMAPDDILKENPDNFSFAHEEIKAVKFREKHKLADKGSIIRRVYGEVTFDTTRGKTEYQMDGIPKDDIAAMKQVLGGKVQD
jgi:hypothetical protein